MGGIANPDDMMMISYMLSLVRPSRPSVCHTRGLVKDG